MLTTQDAVTLCIKLAKHKAYLTKQMEMHEYLGSKYSNRNDNTHDAKVYAYEMALDNFNSLFGEKE